MKSYKYLLAALTVTATLASCSEDKVILGAGEGKLLLTAAVNEDLTEVKRAAFTDQDLADKCQIWISKTGYGLVRKYEGISNVPAAGIQLNSGSYVAEAWTGDSVSASFTERFFKGSQDFTITAGGTSRVTITCTIANVAATVEYDESVDKVLIDYTMTVGHSKGTLTFEGRDTRRGYFMMPNADTDLTWTLEGTLAGGAKFSKTGTIANVERAHSYTLSVKHTPGAAVQEGGAFITIEVDDKAVEIADQIIIKAAPVISGLGFDIAQPVTAQPGEVGKRAVMVSAVDEITNLIITCDEFPALLGLSGNDFDAVRIEDAIRTLIDNGGIYIVYNKDEETGTDQVKINFDETFTDKLTGGTHTINIAATDKSGKTSVADLVFNLTYAKVATDAVDINAVYATSATVSGTVTSEGISACGIKYAVQGSNDWTEVAAAAVPAIGGKYEAKLTGLTPGTTYAYIAYGDGEEASTRTFTTEAAAQLPNAGFEEWSKDGTVVIPGADKSFWDSGNHGSSTMSKNITDQTSDIKHSGNYAAKLVSQFVGLGIIGKFAAGNIFAGRYLYTDGTDGVLGWGRPFTSRPTAMKVWVHYTPGTVDSKGKGDHLAQGSTDQGAIYIALVDETVTKYTGEKAVAEELKGSSWPCIVKTKSSQRSLFDPEGANVIAYGSTILDKTDGSDMIQLTIPIDYRRNIKPSNIILVASASRYGDYFEGGEGSTLVIDDIELVY